MNQLWPLYFMGYNLIDVMTYTYNYVCVHIQLCLTLYIPLRSQLGSSVHGISQARILK